MNLTFTWTGDFEISLSDDKKLNKLRFVIPNSTAHLILFTTVTMYLYVFLSKRAELVVMSFAHYIMIVNYHNFAKLCIHIKCMNSKIT